GHGGPPGRVAPAAGAALRTGVRPPQATPALRHRRSAEALDAGAGAEAGAAAPGGQGVPAAGAPELLEGPGGPAGAGGAERVAEGDGAAVDVDLLGVDAALLLPGEHDRGEGLVDLEQVDLVDADAGALGEALGGVDRAGEHEDGVDAHQAGVDHPRP